MKKNWQNKGFVRFIGGPLDSVIDPKCPRAGAWLRVPWYFTDSGEVVSLCYEWWDTEGTLWEAEFAGMNPEGYSTESLSLMDVM